MKLLLEAITTTEWTNLGRRPCSAMSFSSDLVKAAAATPLPALSCYCRRWLYEDDYS